MCQAFGQGDGGEISTPTKSIVPDMLQAIGKGDAGEILTSHKSLIFNIS